MAVETLKIVLTADNKQAIAGMNETVTSLNKVSAAGAATGGAVTKMGSNFTGLSRVIQDLPYGFNGIANNLTQLVPAAGAAGLAFSAIVTALTFAQVGFGAWTRGMKLASDATTMYNKVNESFIENIAKERSELDSLYITATNANVPMKARNAAVEQMQSKYGSYLSNMDAESIKAGLAADNYMRIVSALNKKAMAQAGEEVKIEKYKELFKIQEKINALNQEYGVGVKKVVEDTSEGYAKINTSAGGVAESTQETADKAEAAATKVADYQKALSKLGLEARNVQSSIDDLNNLIQANTVDPLKPPPDAKVGGGDKIDGKFENYMNNMKALLPILDRFNASDAFQTLFLGKAKPIPLAPQLNTATKDLQNLQLQSTANNTLNNVLAERNAIQLDYEAQLRESKAAALTNTLMNSVNGLFTAMQNGAGLGEALGNMFKQIAIDIAKAAVQAAIFQGILMAFGGGGGLSFGEGFFGGFKKLLGFSQGGTVSGPQSGYPVMLHGTEHIVRPDQMKSIIASAAQMGGGGASRVVVEGRIRGNDIFLSQQRTGTFRNLTT
jgi:hypothetical protein